MWVAKSVTRYAATDVLGTPLKEKLDSAVFLLSWLVLFGPFLFFGVALLLSSFTPEERSWLIPLRVFTYLVGRRFLAEEQRRDTLEKSAGKPLPQSASQEFIDVEPGSARGVKSAKEKTKE